MNPKELKRFLRNETNRHSNIEVLTRDHHDVSLRTPINNQPQQLYTNQHQLITKITQPPEKKVKLGDLFNLDPMIEDCVDSEGTEFCIDGEINDFDDDIETTSDYHSVTNQFLSKSVEEESNEGEKIEIGFNFTKIQMFPGCTIPYFVFVTTLVSFFLQNNISKQQITYFLYFLKELLGPILNKSCDFPVDDDQFFALLYKFDYEKKKYCDQCFSIDKDYCCNKHCSFYLYRGIKNWITDFVNTYGIDNIKKLWNINSDPTKRTDWFDGTEYQRLSTGPFKIVNEKDIVVYTLLEYDGAQHFKKGSSSFWPFLLYILNFPKNVRFLFQHCAIIAFSATKPPISLIIKTIVSDFNYCQNGFLYADHLFKVVLALIQTDNPANNECSGKVGHNGYNGCGVCKERGIMYKGRMVFLMNKEDYSYRSHVEWKSIVDKYFPNYDSRKYDNASMIELQGVTSRSPLFELDYINIVKVFSGELLHDVYLGFFRKLIKGIRMKLTEQEWEEVNIIYSKQRFPIMFHRMPSEITFNKTDDPKGIKGIEYLVIIQYMYPIFKKSAGKIEYSNYKSKKSTLYDFILLVKDFHSLILNPIEDLSVLTRIQKMSLTITMDSIILFGKTIQTLVSHKLTHFSHNIDWNGPMYLHTAFPIEKSIPLFNKFITGTNNYERVCLRNAICYRLTKMTEKERQEYDCFQIQNNHFVNYQGQFYFFSEKDGQIFLFECEGDVIDSYTDFSVVGRRFIVLKNTEQIIPCFEYVEGLHLKLIPIDTSIKHFL